MPELPDVEYFRRIAQQASGHTIDHVDVWDTGALCDVSSNRLHKVLSGRSFGTPRRYGKWLIMPVRQPDRRHGTGDPSVVFHFGMTGELFWAAGNAAEPGHRHDRIVIATELGELRYRDMRKLQGVRVAGHDDEVRELLGETGPDATEITPPQLVTRLKRTSRQVKPALMDQTVLAGLGNLLADEILWRARIHPRRSTRDLPDADVRRIHRRMQTVLRHTMADGRIPTRSAWLTGRRDQDGGRCPRCGTLLRHTSVGARRSVWCPRCQP